jgi:uncharacterized protein DUF885
MPCPRPGPPAYLQAVARRIHHLLCSSVLLTGCGATSNAGLRPLQSSAATPASAGRASWVEKSDENARILLAIEIEFSPEEASSLGVEDADERTLDLTEGFRTRRAAALHEAVHTLEVRRRTENDALVAQDLSILVREANLELREIELSESALVPHWDVARLVFGGIHGLLDDQVAPARRARALARLRAYAGLAPGSAPLVDLARADVSAHLARSGLLAPARIDIEKSLSTTTTLRDGIERLFVKYGMVGYEEPLRVLGRQLASYDEFLRDVVLPRARTDFALPPSVYALRLERVGVDAPRDELISSAHREFVAIQADMQAVAAELAKEAGLPSADYRDALRALKKEQLAGDAILAHYRQRLADIEAIIRRERLVTLPTRPARIRLATEAESAQSPAPHMTPPRLLGNTGEQGEFVLPLGIPAPTGSQGAEQKYDDFAYAAASWTLIAHEARPGHELQFDSMVERGMSLARAHYAFNSTNVEGWGLYSEFIVRPFMPAAGRLVSLQFQLLRAARAFLDPELQQGKWTFASARDFLEKEVGLSAAFATSEFERYTFRSPGQATSYFYGFTRLRALRREVEGKLGPRFDALRFHDAILGEGLLPPDLLREAVNAALGLEGR